MDFIKKKVLVFDLDGTITDSGRGIFNSFKHTFNHYGMNGYDEEFLKRFVGPPLTESFLSLPGFDEIKMREAIEVYRGYYRTIGIFENEVYAGIEELLKGLFENGRKLILATSKAEVFAVKILEHFNIARYFHGVAGSELDGTRIKKHDVLRYALEKFQVYDYNSAVMIGDREYDVLGAKDVGLESIGVLYGYGSREELESAGAAAIAETVEELGKMLI